MFRLLIPGHLLQTSGSVSIFADVNKSNHVLKIQVNGPTETPNKSDLVLPSELYFFVLRRVRKAWNSDRDLISSA